MTLYSLCVGARYVVPSCQLTTLGLLAGHCAGMRWCVQLCPHPHLMIQPDVHEV